MLFLRCAGRLKSSEQKRPGSCDPGRLRKEWRSISQEWNCHVSKPMILLLAFFPFHHKVRRPKPGPFEQQVEIGPFEHQLGHMVDFRFLE